MPYGDRLESIAAQNAVSGSTAPTYTLDAQLEFLDPSATN